jgi:hypothetical protein
VLHISLVQPFTHGEEGGRELAAVRGFRRLNLVTEPDVYPLPNMLDFAAKAVAALKRTPQPEIRPAGGCRPPSSVPDSAYQLVWPHSRRQRTTRRAVLRPPLARLPAHWRQKLVQRWLLWRWLLRRRLLRRWLLRRWLLRRCGLKKRTPPSVCTAAQTDHHRGRGWATQQLAGEPPACAVQQGMAYQ